MQRFLAALRFITIFSFGRSNTFDPAGMLAFFPVVGLFLGLILWGVDQVAGVFLPAPAVAVLLVVLLAVLSGALHLDGLGDTADGLLGHRSREKALEIMKDSRIGVMALVAIVSCMGLKWAGLMSLEGGRNLLIILVPAYARASMLFGIRFMDYGRADSGTGKPFFEQKPTWHVFAGFLPVVCLSALLGWTGIWLNLIFALTTITLIAYYRRRLGCITGDMLGAMTEVNEAVLFFVMAGACLV